MIANSLFAATGVTLALIFFLGNELRFLIPYRFLLLHQCGEAILLYSTVLFANLGALIIRELALYPGVVADPKLVDQLPELVRRFVQKHAIGNKHNRVCDLKAPRLN